MPNTMPGTGGIAVNKTDTTLIEFVLQGGKR